MVGALWASPPPILKRVVGTRSSKVWDRRGAAARCRLRRRARPAGMVAAGPRDRGFGVVAYRHATGWGHSGRSELVVPVMSGKGPPEEQDQDLSLGPEGRLAPREQ